MEETSQIHKPQPKNWYQRILSFWLIREFIIINKLAWPSVITAFGAQMIPFTSLVFTGHIGVGTYLDGASLALSFANVTGTSIVIGFSSGMDTLCSQAYGGKNYRLVGVYFQRAIILSLLVCFPIWALWLNAESILILLHQDVEVAAIAGKYLRILCVAKPAVVLFTLSTKFLQTQNVVNPTIFLTVIGNVVNISCQYLFVVHLGFGVEGSAISISISYWSLAILYVMYIRCSPLYHTSWPGWGSDAFRGWLHYCKYGIPGLIMMCLEWWTFEVGFLVVGGTSANPKVEIGIYSVMFNVSSQLFSVPIGFTVAATVRVGNLLGANNPALARKVSFLCISIILAIGMHFSVGVFLLKSHLPLLFTSDECIIAGATSTLFITAIYETIDGFQLVMSGILKGCGRQGIASIINLLAFQLIALPLAICLCVVLKMDTMGYWIGLASAIAVQAVLFFILLLCMDWRKLASNAQENVGIIKHNGHNKDNGSTYGSVTSCQSSKEDIESSALLTSYVKPILIEEVNKSWYRDLIKLALIAMFIASFALGLGFYFDHSTPTKLFGSGLFNSSDLNATEICPYSTL
ncbi:Multidrug and toxin extrusion protein 1-like [Oopsacas minuta]|uniref:Multidrug and toxin extrusion protein n=1 Tax=Oopsacas minuta TaxID=111878 RepID=A0AAV7JHX9_9METZ|nr:Multidrug and toxin extrusion protein 1-like [Oopsacas minuta]